MSDESQPVGIGPVLGAAGPCPVIVHKGKSWTVGHPTQKAKSWLEKLVAACALETLAELKDVLPPDEYLARRASLDQNIYQKQHRTWGPLWTTVTSGEDGDAVFLLSLLKLHHPEATMADARELHLNANREVGLAFAEVLPAFFTLLVETYPVQAEDRQAVAEEYAKKFQVSPPKSPTTETTSDKLNA